MSCSPFDLRDYFLKELARPQALLVEEHVRQCPSCQEELDGMRLTEAALFALRDEEIPQRIGFVSHPVLEPAPWRRWLAAFWTSGPRLGFASATMLSAAILVFALNRPAPEPSASAPAPVATASLSPDLVKAQIKAAVEMAVKESEARQSEKATRMVSELVARERADQEKLARAKNLIQDLTRRNGTLTFQSANYRGEQTMGRPQ
jgi:hypothetical protein